MILITSYSGTLQACYKNVCFGDEPNGQWVTTAVFPSLACGNATDSNTSCVDYVGDHPVGSQITVCRRSNIPDDWDIVRGTLSAACGNGAYNAVEIVRKQKIVRKQNRLIK